MSRARWTSTVLALLMASTSLGVMLTGTAANADTTISLSIADVVLAEKCGVVPLAFELTLPPDSAQWYVDGTVSNGPVNFADIDVVSGAGGGTVDGEARVDLCSLSSEHSAGTYRITLEGSYSTAEQVADGSGFTRLTVATTTFNVRKSHTSTKLAVSTHHPHFDQVVHFKMRVQLEAAGRGYIGYPNDHTTLQVRVPDTGRGRWKNLALPVKLRPNGKASLNVRWNTRAKLTIRLSTPGAYGHSASDSGPITITSR